MNEQRWTYKFIFRVFVFIIIMTATTTGIAKSPSSSSSTSTASRTLANTTCGGDRARTILKCLSLIRTIFSSDDLFWFGKIYSSLCPSYKTKVDISCYKDPVTTTTVDAISTSTTTIRKKINNDDSLLTLLFRPGEFNVKRFDRYLNVSYRSPQGQYKACANTYKMDAYPYLEVNPSAATWLTPWQMRKMPDVHWVQFNSDPQHYTLMFYDSSNSNVKGLYTNILENKLTISTEVIRYEGPMNFRNFSSPFLILLFLQEYTVDISTEWRRRFLKPVYRFLGNFTREYNLDGPVAVNWALVSTDLYATEQNRISNIVDNCPHYIARALAKHERTFIPPNLHLYVGLYVSFTSASITYQSCCNEYKSNATVVYLNPLANGTAKAVDTRSGVMPNVTISFVPFDQHQMEEFRHSLFTLVMVDPDIPEVYHSLGNSTYPLIHWMTINIIGKELSTGEEVHAYIGPLPPDENPHFYYFVLLKQPRRLKKEDLEGFYSDCGEALKGRCLFRMRQFVQAKDLVFAGATWMAIENDKYVRGVYLRQGSPPDEVCKQSKYYQPGCLDSSEAVRPTSGHGIIFAFYYFLLLLVTVVTC
ncbi:uncharacterized protein C56G2.4-like [Octopus sinensis]|uniref:Uncharacterized protein C56G2.4-like n=1 Tax=Octopus sinensis TaxID=2607531 RepID=A0A7E6F797_9MOLL|nr:uncharacterized protein C56G2.4-like [Octopus sinensis]